MNLKIYSNQSYSSHPFLFRISCGSIFLWSNLLLLVLIDLMSLVHLIIHLYIAHFSFKLSRFKWVSNLIKHWMLFVWWLDLARWSFCFFSFHWWLHLWRNELILILLLVLLLFLIFFFLFRIFLLLKSHLLKILINHFLLWRIGFSMNRGVKFGMIKELLIVLHKLSPSFFIKWTLWKWYYQQALNNLKNVRQWPLWRIPIFFQSIDTYFSTRYSYIWVENLSEKVAFWRLWWELTVNY